MQSTKNIRLLFLLLILSIVLIVFLILDYMSRKSQEEVRALKNQGQSEAAQIDLCLYGVKSIRLNYCPKLIKEGKQTLKDINTTCKKDPKTTEVKYFAGTTYQCNNVHQLSQEINSFIVALQK